MDSNRPAVRNFFRERHIRLRERWLDSVFAFLRHKHYGQVAATVLSNLIYEQWLFSDLSASSEPASPEMSDMDTMTILEAPIVLQVKTVLDISASFYSQVKSLTDDFVDNSGFEVVDEFERKEIIKEAKAQRTLHLTLTNGSEDFEAFEWKPCRELSFLTKPGAKVLLLPPIKCRRGQFMLEPSIFQVLGGDLDQAMEAFNPIAVMSEKLGIVPRGPKITISNQRPALAPIQQASPTRVRPYEAQGTENELNQLNTALNRSMIMEGGLLDDDDFEGASEPPATEGNYEEDILNQQFIEESDSDDGDYSRRGRIRRRQLEYVTSTSPTPESPPRYIPSANRSSTTTANTTMRTESLFASFSRTPALNRREQEARRKSALRQEGEYNFNNSDFDDFDQPSTSSSNLKTSFLDRALGDDDANSRPSTSKSRPSLTAFAAPVVAKPGPSTSSKPAPIVDPRRRRTTNDIRQFVKAVPPLSGSQPSVPKSSSISVKSPLKKKVKVEEEDVICLSSDEEDVKPDLSKLKQQMTEREEEGRMRKEAEEKRKREKERSEKKKAEETKKALEVDWAKKNPPPAPVVEELPPTVKLFKSLGVTTIAEAMNRTRFGIASKRFRILGTVGKSLEPLRIVDDCWTMKVQLSDTSMTVACYVDDPTLTRMIGWTPQEGERAKNSSDEFRREEGARRIKGVEEQFRRLDLVMDVEFFPPRISDPVVRYLDTLYETMMNAASAST